MAVTPVFLPGKSHEGRSLVGYSPWGHKELDTTKWQKVKLKYIAHGTELNFMWQPGCQRNLEEGVCVCVCVCVCEWLSCVWFCSPQNFSPPGSSVHGILQARILKWVAFPSPGDLPNPEIKPGTPALQPNSLLFEAPGKPLWGEWIPVYVWLSPFTLPVNLSQHC